MLEAAGRVADLDCSAQAAAVSKSRRCGHLEPAHNQNRRCTFIAADHPVLGVLCGARP